MNDRIDDTRLSESDHLRARALRAGDETVVLWSRAVVPTAIQSVAFKFCEDAKEWEFEAEGAGSGTVGNAVVELASDASSGPYARDPR